jgi:hypothetical protein
VSHNFSRHLKIPHNFLCLKMLTTHLGNGTQILDSYRSYSINKPSYFSSVLFNLFVVSSDVVFAFSIEEGVNFCFFPNNLTVEISTHEFVIVSNFSAHLTNDLNPKIPSCLLDKIKKVQQWSLFAVSHPAKQSTFSYWEMPKCHVYRFVFV